MRVWMSPTPSQALNDSSNSIHQIVLKLQKHLRAFDVELVENPDGADLRVGHAGQGSQQPMDVAHIHGLYPTAQFGQELWWLGANISVINNIRTAKAVTVPSEWVGDILRRDMHLNPRVIGWAIDPEEWQPGNNQGYVLWNKTRVDSVCDPKPMLELAQKAHDTLFLTTFGSGTPNVRAIGRQTYEVMRGHIRSASVYLATTKETFGIGILEAMACGIPVLGFRWGGITDIVEHGVTGFLAEPGDIQGLKTGLEYCKKHREVLGQNARAKALTYTWDKVAQSFANLYREVLAPASGIKVSVVIPCHNYGRFVGEALQSVFNQQTSFRFQVELILDRCSDNSRVVADEWHRRFLDHPKAKLVFEETDYGNPADARNYGIQQGHSDYITCLDADDRLNSPNFLQTLAEALDADRTLGIAFTGIQMMDAAGNLGNKSGWPNGFDFNQQLQRHNQVPTCNLFRREAWVRAGGYRNYNCPAEDADLWTRICALGYRAQHVVDDGWFAYRLHNNSLSTEVRTGKRREPDWLQYHPYAKDGLHPFASAAKPEYQRPSHPVRNYDTPEIAVIIPIGYPEHVPLLVRAIDSVEGQTFRNWECIVVNDTGRELDIRQSPFVRVVPMRSQKGAGAARNAGAEAATAPYLTFLDADDYLEPRFMEETLRAFKRTGRYVYTDWMSVSKAGDLEQHQTPDYSFAEVFNRSSIHAVNVLIPRAIFEAIGGFDTDMQAWEDVDFFMKLAVKGFCGVRVPLPLFTYQYPTGRRRELGETIKEDLKTLLRERYGAYMRGEKMCQCDVPVKPSPNGTADLPAEDIVKVEYVKGPLASAPLKGRSGRDYGSRAQGEVFYVFKADVEDERFRVYQEFAIPAAQTVLPPPPMRVLEMVSA